MPRIDHVAKTARGRATSLICCGALALGAAGAVAGMASASPAFAATTAVTQHAQRATVAAAAHRGHGRGQSWMSMSRAQFRNARTIVRQAMIHGMGARSAVIAVATAMQESKLVNVNYGTSDSFGLFQQQPDCGWGSHRQVMNPVYSSDAFLKALSRYQESHPGWRHEPLWMAAQGVQRSAYPRAYQQWEKQAGHIVKKVLRELNR
jgi:hypothetical protein